MNENGWIVLHFCGGARQEIHVPAGEGDSNAGMLKRILCQGRLCGIHQCFGAQRVREAKHARAFTHALHMFKPTEDAPMSRRHRLKETNAVLEPGIERRDLCIRHGNKGTVEPSFEHGGKA